MSLHRLALTSLLTLSSLVASAQALNEGPHVFWENRTAKVVEIVDGKVVQRALGAGHWLSLPDMPSVQLNPDGIGTVPDDVPKAVKVTAVSDVHGNGAGFRKLLQAHGVMDAKATWKYGAGHLVVLGDIADRGPDVTKSYWLVRSLQQQAVREGGMVHFVMGNHEAMVLRHDTRYAHPRFLETGALLHRDMSGLVAHDTELGLWLRAQPAVLRVGHHLFVHGGLSPSVVRAGSDLEGINQQFRSQLRSGENASLLGGAGPLWYRGLIPGMEKKQPESTTKDVDALLKAFKVKAVVVGHSTLDRVTSFHDGRVFGIDAGLKDGKPGEVWIWEDGKVYRGLADGQRVPVVGVELPKAAGL